MSKTKDYDWHLSNGFTFLAVELKSPGEWSRHYDLSTCLGAMQSKPTIINLFYTHKTTEVSWCGGLDYNEQHGKPLKLGCYHIKGRGKNFTIKGIDLSLIHI